VKVSFVIVLLLVIDPISDSITITSTSTRKPELLRSPGLNYYPANAV